MQLKGRREIVFVLEVPPRVEYNLTDLGKSFIPVFEHMKQWGDENLSE